MKKILIIILFALASCQAPKTVQLGAQVSQTGVEMGEKGIQMYQLLLSQAGIDKRHQERIKILTNPSPATMLFPNDTPRSFGAQIAPRIDAYYSLIEVYRVFSLLSDAKYANRSKEAINALQSSYSKLEKLPDLPDKVKTKLPQVMSALATSIQAKKIKEHNAVLYQLADTYYQLWMADLKSWEEYVDRVYNDYMEPIRGLEMKRYDIKKIAKDLDEPYGDDAVLVMLFKLQQCDEIMAKRDKIKQQLYAFGSGLRMLADMHAEISKQQTDIELVMSSLNKIVSFLKSK